MLSLFSKWPKKHKLGRGHLWNAKLTETQIFIELSNLLESSLIELVRSLCELERLFTKLERYLLPLKSSLIQIESSLYIFMFEFLLIWLSIDVRLLDRFMSSFVKFCSAIKGEVKNVSANQRSRPPSFFSNQPEKLKLCGGH